MGCVPDLITAAFPLVVSGPSGVGKTVLCETLIQRFSWMVRSTSATTRAPREDESDGESYFFYSRERFESERAKGAMVEWAEVHGHLYGTPKLFLEEKLASGFCVVLNIDVQGGLSIRRHYPEAVLVFLVPPSMEALAARLRARQTDTEERVSRRLDQAQHEMAMLPQYDYVVLNDDLERAQADLVAVSLAERARVARRLPLRFREEAGR